MDRGTLLGAVEDGNILGICGFYANDFVRKRAFASCAVVDLKSRGKGVGRKLFQRAFEIASAAGMTHMYGTPRKNNLGAISLYQRFGNFQIVGENADDDSRYDVIWSLNLVPNILLSAVGRRSYLVDYFKRLVHPLGGRVCATNTIREATGFLAADEAEIVPPSRDPSYVDRMLELCVRWKVRLLFSLHDWDAPVLARARARFLEVGTIPVMASAETMATCLDKYETVRAMERIGVPVPSTALSVEEALGRLSFPMIVKPRWGQGSLGLFKAGNAGELRMFMEVSTMEARKFAAACPEIDPEAPQVIVQDYLSGAEYGCDIVNDLNGKFRKAFVKHKFAMRSGETDAAESTDHPEIAALAERIGAWSGHLGCMDSDWRLDADGNPRLIELNPRFGGGYPFTHCAGADICRACVDWARGVDDGAWCAGYRTGIVTYKEIRLRTLR